MSNIVTFESRTRPQYAVRVEAQLISHFEFLAAQARREDSLVEAVRATTHYYGAQSLLDPFAVWWGPTPHLGL